MSGFNVGLDYTTLFGSLSGSSQNSGSYVSSLASLVSDYNSIKDGSYGKVVEKYYEKYGKSAIQSAVSDTTTTDNTSVKADATTASAADALENTVTDLSKDSLYTNKNYTTTDSDGNKITAYGYDMNSLYNKVSEFASNYNTLLTSGTSSTAANVSSRTSYLKTVTGLNSEDLSAIGITADSKTGKLSVDKDSFLKSDISDIKDVFDSTSGYAYQVSSAANIIESAATTSVLSGSSSGYTSSGTYNSLNLGVLFDSIT